MRTSNGPVTVFLRHFSLRRFGVTVFGLVALAATACGSSAAARTPVPANGSVADAEATTGTSATNLEENLLPWSVASDELNVVLATPDLGVGEQRFALVLSDLQGLVKFPVIEFASYRYPDTFSGQREGPVESTFARFTEFPFGTRGTHVAHVTFDSPGNWAIEATVPRSNGSSATAEVRFTVQERPISVSVGDAAPPSRNRTLSDVGHISELTTGSFRDEELYRSSVASAIERERPFVIVFASPAFCTNAVCGPQVKVVSELREQYAADADFIHVDLYENPAEIQGDLSRAIESPLLNEWRLISQEWTFVVGSDGLITARFENFVGVIELREALESAIEIAGNA
jgi:hypothetical protein